MRDSAVVLSGDSCCYVKRHARLDRYTYIYYNLHCVVVHCTYVIPFHEAVTIDKCRRYMDRLQL